MTAEDLTRSRELSVADTREELNRITHEWAFARHMTIMAGMHDGPQAMERARKAADRERALRLEWEAALRDHERVLLAIGKASPR